MYDDEGSIRSRYNINSRYDGKGTVSITYTDQCRIGTK